MRASVASLARKTLCILCAVALCCGFPVSALADESNLLSIPGGSEGASRIAISAEEVNSEAFSHYPSDDAASADAGGAAITPEEGAAYINEEVPLAATRGFTEVDLTGGAEEGAIEESGEEAGETSVLSLESASTYAATQHRIYFEANGGSYVPYNVYKAAQGELMPNISGELAYVSGKPAPPSKAGCVFTGFYDGSDYTRAKKYYNASFQVDATCDGRTYPADAEGLTLYAGFAPVLNVSVPLRVSIAMGTVDELGEPTVASAEIVNATAAWPVVFTTLKWEEGDGTVSSEGMVAASETVNSLLAKKVELAPSTMEAMFTDPASLTLKVTANGKTVAVPYGGSVKLSDDAATNPLYLEAAPSTLPGVTGERRLTVEFAIDKGTSSIKQADAVAETRLLSSYEAVTGWDEPSSFILFDMQGAQGGQVDRLPAKLGDTLPALTEGSAPYLNGYDFLGYADEEGTLWYAPDGSGAIVPVANSWGHASAAVLHPVWNTKDCTVVFTAGPVGSSATVAGTRVYTASVKYNETLGTAFGTNKVPNPHWEDAASGREYRFLGWFDEDGLAVSDGTIITRHDGTTSITARWAGAPVTVTWDKSAANATSVDPTSLESGSAVGTLPATTRPGYTFSGWFTRPGGEGSPVTASTVVYESATFYASWTANYVNVSFLLDGTTFACAPQLYDDGTVPALVLPQGFPASPTKEAHRFLGWYESLSNNAFATTPLDLTSAKLPAADTVYVGKWEARVTYDPAGGSFVGNETGERYVAIGDSLNSAIPSRDTVKREGYEFAGWYSAAQGGFQASPGTLVSEPTTFYARWRGEECELTVNPYFSDVSWSETVLVENGEKPENLGSVPTKIGYKLLGFYDDATKSDATLVFATDGTSLITWDRASDATITARWIDLSTGAIVPELTPAPAPGEVDPSAPFAGEDPVNVHVATTPAQGSALSARAFDGASNKELLSGTYRGSLMWNGASDAAPAANDTVVITVSAYEAATDKDIDTLLATFAKEGQTLLGFEVASTGCFLSAESLKSPSFMLKVKGSDLSAATSVPTANLKDGALVALYGSANRVSVIDVFDANGGTFQNGSTRKTVVNIAGSAPLVCPAENPSRLGYDFDNWWTMPEGGSQVNIGNWSTPSTSTVFYAHWKTSPYKITYDLAGGTNASGNPQGYGVEHPDITLAAPTRTGYDFTGWSGTGLTGNANMTVTIPAGSMGDRSYTAHWTPITYTISFAPDNVNRSQELLHRSSADPVTYTIESDDFTLAVPTSTNYDFIGWSGEGLAGTDIKEVTIPKGTTGNKTYTANWTIKTFTVSYNAILADAPENWPQTSERVEYGAGIAITNEKPTRESYTFRGWSEANNPNSTIAQYLSGQALDSVVRNIELYAVWEWVGSFYLDLTAEQASAINAVSGEQLLDVKKQRLSAKTIKEHATDISNNSTNSRYYKMYEYVMDQDIKFISNWQNVTINNHDNKNTSPSTYVNSGYNYEVRLIGLDQDYLTANKSGKRAGMTFQFANVTLSWGYQFNNSGTTVAPWAVSQLRAALNSSESKKATQSTLAAGDEKKRSSIWDRAPKTLTDNIQSVYKFTHNAGGNENNTASAVGTTLDQFFLASHAEVVSAGNVFPAYPWAANEIVYGNQYRYWKNKKITGVNPSIADSTESGWDAGSNNNLFMRAVSNVAPSLENLSNGSRYWFRSYSPGRDYSFLAVVNDGGKNSKIAGAYSQNYDWLCVVPCFCF